MTNRTLRIITLLLIITSCALAQSAPTIDALQNSFQTPPDDSRIMMRWWWFGPSQTKEEIAAELQHMKAAGIGGVELQATYPMAVDDPAHDFRNYRFLSPEFLEMVGYASRTAKDLGLRMDLTIGSGWPYGGPYIPMNLAAMRLRMDARQIAPGRTSVTRPVPYEGEHLIAAFIARGALGETAADTFLQLDLAGDGAISLPKDDGPRTLTFFISSPTGQDVKRAAIGAEGYILDHYNRAAIETHLHEAGDKLLGAAEPGSIHSIFCDSLEVFDANWTGDLLSEFLKRRGYDLRPLLPLLEFDTERSSEIRRDYGRTLTEVFEDRFLVPMHDWAARNRVLFRMQDYGMPPASISSYRYVDLPEGEGFPWRKLTSTRWAASAAHLFGKPVVSSETWTWIHSPAFRATPLDLKAEADLHFLMGINQLIGHGWPYSPAQARDPGWTFYAAGALNDKNPWWPVMPDLSRYLQRISYVLRQGTPVVDVALYAPYEDVYAALTPVSSNFINLFERTGEQIGPNAIPAILDAGFNFDVIDDGTLAEAAKQHYKIIVLAGTHFIPEATKNWLREYQSKGGVVLAVDQKPEGEWPGLEVVSENDLSRRLASLTEADLKLDNGAEDIGHVHRQLGDADIYFLANTSNLPHSVHAQFRADQPYAELWDPMSGNTQSLKMSDGRLQLDLEPYASRVIVFRARSKLSVSKRLIATRGEQDLSSGWMMNLPNSTSKSVNLPYSWAAETATQFFSGTATFTRELTLSIPEAASHLYLDFGAAVPTEREALSAHTLRGYSFAALVTPPIREAATVFVNNQRAGSVWSPPYQVDLTGLLKAGANSIKVEVYNTAINELAEGGRLADTDALTKNYGLRFKLQDFDNLKPLPSGIMSTVKLVTQR